MDPLGKVTKEFSLAPHTAQYGTEVLPIPWHGHFDRFEHVFRLPTYTGGRNGVIEILIVCGGEIEVMLALEARRVPASS